MKEAWCGGDWSVLDGELKPPLLELKWRLKGVFTWTVTKHRGRFVLTHSHPRRLVNDLNGNRYTFMVVMNRLGLEIYHSSVEIL